MNKSLLSLGDVFAALVKCKGGHIPHRNSKLTYLLQDSFGGDSKTLMFVNVSEEKRDDSYKLSSLQFAQRVSKVELGTAKRHNHHNNRNNRNNRNPDPKALRKINQQSDDLVETFQSVPWEVHKQFSDGKAM